LSRFAFLTHNRQSTDDILHDDFDIDHDVRRNSTFAITEDFDDAPPPTPTPKPRAAAVPQSPREEDNLMGFDGHSDDGDFDEVRSRLTLCNLATLCNLTDATSSSLISDHTPKLFTYL
jgi:hypothetical protein